MIGNSRMKRICLRGRHLLIDTGKARIRREKIESSSQYIVIQKRTQGEYPVKNSSIVTALGCLNGL
jgi:hypothetical protein